MIAPKCHRGSAKGWDASRIPGLRRRIASGHVNRIACFCAANGPGSPRLRNLSIGPYADFRHAGNIDALDWYGIWKRFDALADATFRGCERDVALGGGPAQLSMGAWSDGVPVKPMRVLR